MDVTRRKRAPWPGCTVRSRTSTSTSAESARTRRGTLCSARRSPASSATSSSVCGSATGSFTTEDRRRTARRRRRRPPAAVTRTRSPRLKYVLCNGMRRRTVVPRVTTLLDFPLHYPGQLAEIKKASLAALVCDHGEGIGFVSKAPLKLRSPGSVSAPA